MKYHPVVSEEIRTDVNRESDTTDVNRESDTTDMNLRKIQVNEDSVSLLMMDDW
jgi:hypothetical protein